jgi:hypothetical protein
MSDFYHIRLGTTYTAVFEFFKKVKNVPSYCEVAIHNDYPPMGQGIWKISPELKKLLSKVDHFNIQGDKSLSELLWIVYHLAKNNAVLAFANLNHEKQDLITQGYYKDKLQKLSFNNYQILPKVILDDENKIDGVSFCIPTGGDSPQLRKCVERILSFKTPKEIILSGSVSDDFPYKDQVKIVGEDIPYPPIRISEKKNVAIESAKYSLACVLHDRVLLPKNFDEIFENLAPVPVMAIGGLFNLTGDWNLVGRYSDFNVAVKKESSNHSVQYLRNSSPSSVFTKETGFFYARHHEWFYTNDDAQSDNCTYVTGSFFLVSKSAFENEKLNKEFFWDQFEDVEWGVRCYYAFIPHVFNTDFFQLTQLVRAVVLPPPTRLLSADKITNKIMKKDVLMPPERISYSSSLKDRKTTQSIYPELQNFISRFITFFDKNRNNLSKKQLFLAEKHLLDNERDKFVDLLDDMLIKAAPVEYDESFIKDVERLIAQSFEIVDLNDQKIHCKHFNETFNFGNRVIKNWSFLKWKEFFIRNLIIKDPAQICSSSKKTIRTNYSNSVVNCDYLNEVFSLKYNPEQWFEIFKNLED